MALKWMNTSAPPSRPRKPYPFGLLKHLTLPLMRSTGVLALFCRLAQQGKIVVAKGKNYRMISCQPPHGLVCSKLHIVNQSRFTVRLCISRVLDAIALIWPDREFGYTVSKLWGH